MFSQAKMDLLVVHILEGEHSTTMFFLSLFLFLVILLLISLKKPQTTRYKLPPSPFKLPIIGNLHQVRGGSLHRILHSLAQKHGSLMIIHLGCIPTLVVSSVDAAREVIKTYDYCFSGRPQLIIPRRLTYYGKDIAFAQYGDHWRELRKVCVAKLLNAKKAQSCSPLRIQEVCLMLDKIMKSWLSNSAVNLSQIFISFTNNMICKVAFGKKYGEGESIKEFKKIVKEFTTLLGAVDVGDMIPSLSWVNHFNGLNKRVEKNVQALDSFLDMIVQEHIEKKTGNGGEGGDEEEDLVEVMLGIEKDSTLGFDRDVTKAMLLDMFAGGTDTTSVVLEWGMSELLKHPEIMEEVQREVRDVAREKLVLDECDTKEMPLLRSVIKETLRMHPPFPIVPRETSEKVILQGYDIPTNTRVMLSMYAIGRDPLYWDEPDKFWPKRFMEGKSASVDFRGQDIQLIPFGAGRRGCPGIYFATPSLELVFANILNRFDWMLPEGVIAEHMNMDEGPGMTAYRKNELLLTVKPFY